ncbi:MAG: hypothetical protein DKT66_06525 [Candidatus Melainabacteria bacterium]|nr:MAG: hypothetical protein DKT66_06525 [Candidatus Melainabacteria bacterium]
MAIPFESANGQNYRKGRGTTKKPSLIIIHVMQGTFDGTRSWFKNSKAKVSAHYLVSKKGDLLQMVADSDTAWHCRNANQKSIGIEHEGYVENASDFTDEMLKASAQVVKQVAKAHGIPIDRSHLKGHNEMPGNDHFDPGQHWPWDKYIALCKS